LKTRAFGKNNKLLPFFAKIRKDGKTYFILLLSVMVGNGEIYEKCGNKKEAMPLGGMDGRNKKN
jgi:hypothetical protein